MALSYDYMLEDRGEYGTFCACGAPCLSGVCGECEEAMHLAEIAEAKAEREQNEAEQLTDVRAFERECGCRACRPGLAKTAPVTADDDADDAIGF